MNVPRERNPPGGAMNESKYDIGQILGVPVSGLNTALSKNGMDS